MTVVSHIYSTDVSVHLVSESNFMVPVTKQIKILLTRLSVSVILDRTRSHE
jgi:hypothetical protein